METTFEGSPENLKNVAIRNFSTDHSNVCWRANTSPTLLTRVSSHKTIHDNQLPGTNYGLDFCSKTLQSELNITNIQRGKYTTVIFQKINEIDRWHNFHDQLRLPFYNSISELEFYRNITVSIGN